tara:strand:+ start:1211 stop:1318 length:108 start_codon:yes stop_codon:yes gene_type:complete
LLDELKIDDEIEKDLMKRYYKLIHVSVLYLRKNRK